MNGKTKDEQFLKASSQAVHAGHRQRMKAKLLSAQFDQLYSHELLELLLFYAIPRKDTNELAHQLLAYYNGSFQALLEADPKDLMKLDGVGENVAALIVLIRSILRETEKQRLSEKRSLNVLSDIVEYTTALFSGYQKEVFYIICLNNAGKVLAYEKISEGGINQIMMEPRAVLEAALKYRQTKQVILAHNHPSGNIAPSGSDIDATRAITLALNTVGIQVKDHIIVSNHRYYSFAENSMLY